MDKKTVEIIELVKKYISELERNNIPIKTAILFGSYANGNYHKWSDIDLALVSEKFVGNRLLDRQKIAPINLKFNFEISSLPYNPEEFDENEDLFVKEILKTGIRIV